MRNPVTRAQMDKIEDDFVFAMHDSDRDHDLSGEDLQEKMRDFHHMVELDRELSKTALAQLGDAINRFTVKEQA